MDLETMPSDFTPVKPVSAALVLASGDVFYGQGLGYKGEAVAPLLSKAITSPSENKLP